MVLIGLAVFLVILMVIQFCQVDYKSVDYIDGDGVIVSACCYQNSTGYNAISDVCTGAPENVSESILEKDLLENIKVMSPHIYVIIILIIMGLAVLGAILMID